jgi:hypothetical protein
MALRQVGSERRSARQSQIRERIQWRERRIASMIENLLELRCRFRQAA